ncbi:Carbohydrate-Binding Module Family 14 protein [Gigaspora rosea]|uniref:Carbohydrate-Binding Module Family 14 protein n=1 Tax=Gigaspora rosea TaxID=44941 RepID=A0A397TVC9_9GLOM|nr:Carbohydrate-Binding Module Family 14 protein [Gigaspora rosea]
MPLYTIFVFGGIIETGLACKELANGLYANPYDCKTFYQCSNGVAYLFDCPDDLQWSSNLQRCEWPINSDCGVTECIL